jgi:6-phosphogluconolactonase
MAGPSRREAVKCSVNLTESAGLGLGSGMHHQLESLAAPAAVAVAGAAFVAERARAAVAASGSFHFAVSGGHTPWAMFAELASQQVPWDAVIIYQVDERVAPSDDPDRNLAHLTKALGSAPAQVRAMPVEDSDLAAAAADYAASLPTRFDLVHLGLGPDGHTASLVPGDPVLAVTDRLVGLTQPYQGRVRMTLTYPALARARQLLWLVTGADKQVALAKLLAGDTTIPAGRVEAAASLVIADRAAT